MPAGLMASKLPGAGFPCGPTPQRRWGLSVAPNGVSLGLGTVSIVSAETALLRYELSRFPWR